LACYSQQTYPNRELIVVDDGDRFPVPERAVAEAGGQLVRVPTGTILGSKLNAGLTKARGPVCQKMDDDDWYGPRFLQIMVEHRRKSQSAVCRPTVQFVAPFLFFEIKRWQIRLSRSNTAPGATLMFALEDWRERPFRALSQDEDVWFYRDQRSRGGISLLVNDPEIFLAVRHAGSQRDRSHTWVVGADGRALEDALKNRPLHRQPEDILPEWALEVYRGLRTELLDEGGRLAEAFRYVRTGVPARPAPRAAAAEAYDYRPSSKLHAAVRDILSREKPRALVVQNIADNQGDEIIRCVPLLQALADSDPRLEIVLHTRRAYLYAHPRITAKPLTAPIEGRFDAVIDFYEPDVREMIHRPELEVVIQEYLQKNRPPLVLAARKGPNHFTWQRVAINGRSFARELGLDRQLVKNVYETTFRLIAELGLPLRTGEQTPASEWVLAGVALDEAENAWRQLTAGNTQGRPVALVNPFGGAEPLKGYPASQSKAAAALIRRLITGGYFVILAPNGTPWGSRAHARAVHEHLTAADQSNTSIGPDAADTPDRDAATRMLIYFVRFADLIVAVEGWMIHAAYCLGKPYRTVMMPYSHPPDWQPFAQTPNQYVDDAVPPLDFDEQGEFVVEQPRKQTLLAMIEDLACAVDSQALPFLLCALQSADRDVRTAAAGALAERFEPEARSALLAALDDPYYLVRAAAAGGLRTAENVPREVLEAHVLIGSPRRDWSKVVQLGLKARPAVERAVHDEDFVVRREAPWAMLRLDAMTPPHPVRRAFDMLLSRGRPGVIR
jgi:ADP-heptose:LPS heptosyltransferase